MSAFVFFAVLAAALLHAGWNALVRSAANKEASMAAVTLGHVPPALLAVLLLPVPALAAWPWLLFGVALHVGYQFFLMTAYRHGELGLVYPLARGAAPMLVALVSVAVLGVTLTGQETLAVLLIGAGLALLALVRGADALGHWRAVVPALVTAGFIAGYSLVDGTGARLSGSPVAYFGWLAMINAVFFSLLIEWRTPGQIRWVLRNDRRLILLGGGASFVAYAIVTWAFTQAPIALVAALRETSIVFALIIGAVAMKERLGPRRILAAGLVLGGAAFLRLAA